ncbi:hypothetical protein B6D60_03480 [candidate division KSB1 bacterium 4484_87]|nr:MAG: hypothetical protein B6D60_03480 [candidate division KSB1 bacterium 4484_87]
MDNLFKKHLKLRLGIKMILLNTLLLFLSCAPGPPPPLFPAFLGSGLGWLLLGALIWIGFILLRNNRESEKPKDRYLVDTINAINHRLQILEERMEKLEVKIRDDSH